MKVVFESPKRALDVNGEKIWANGFNPTIAKDFDLIPNEPGVYVYGVNLLCHNDGSLNHKFMPLYIGISDNLRNRLKNHYKGLTSKGNGKKEIFNLSHIQCNRNNIVSIYSDMQAYDNHRGLHPNRFCLDSLIWFNDSSFFAEKLKLPKGSSKYIPNSGVQSSIKVGGDLDTIQRIFPNGRVNSLKDSIVNTKSIYETQFYFFFVKLSDVYPTISNNHSLYSKEYRWKTVGKRDNGMYVAEIIEHTTKEKLKSIKIYTTAEAQRHIEKMDIDLSLVQNELINMTGNPFQPPLIL